MELNEILALPVKRHDLSKTITIKQFLFDLLKTLWIEQESFDGKRPWGNSGWDYDLYVALIKNKVIPGKLDEDNYVMELDEQEAHGFVLDKIIKPLFNI